MNAFGAFQSAPELPAPKEGDEEKELEDLRKVGADVVDEKNGASIRLANRHTKGLYIDTSTGTAK